MLSDGAPTVAAAGCTHHCRTSFSETGTNRKKVNQQTEHITVPTEPLLPSVYSLFQGPITAYRLWVHKTQRNVEGGRWWSRCNGSDSQDYSDTQLDALHFG